MVKYYESNTVFQFNWSQVAQGFWKRYPNPHSSHVLSEDTITREVKDGKLYSKRLLTKTNRVPKWGEKFISKNVVKIIEETVVDPKEKTLTSYTRNLGYTKVMSVIEKVTYKVSEDNPEWTVAHRLAWIDSSVFGFGHAIKAFGLDRFKKNCGKMTGGFNYVLAHMFPATATLINPNFAQLTLDMNNFDEPMTKLSHAAEDLQHSFHDKAEKMKDAAKKATDLAKKKAYAACQPNQS
ncbi:GSCOCG00004427001-RA-CDS [Cotesia congregata]|uniref:Similar to prel: Protein preli-like (Drosophila melanogaster) n=1 Tax=Cotesia congregata TaxID=51543 RepID=A0A8J2ED45_COTCN|nr:GSCOCG00004427001-RA-CDS [Cotesia congregata]CAG5075712.1 Similar to prel: Protein preli-like (Drosophila melanogaster) [Cotesia congregata]